MVWYLSFTKKDTVLCIGPTVQGYLMMVVNEAVYKWPCERVAHTYIMHEYS